MEKGSTIGKVRGDDRADKAFSRGWVAAVMSMARMDFRWVNVQQRQQRSLYHGDVPSNNQKRDTETL